MLSRSFSGSSKKLLRLRKLKIESSARMLCVRIMLDSASPHFKASSLSYKSSRKSTWGCAGNMIDGNCRTAFVLTACIRSRSTVHQMRPILLQDLLAMSWSRFICSELGEKLKLNPQPSGAVLVFWESWNIDFNFFKAVSLTGPRGAFPAL